MFHHRKQNKDKSVHSAHQKLVLDMYLIDSKSRDFTFYHLPET